MDAFTAELLLTYPIAADVYPESVALSPNGKYIASGSDDSTVQIWNANASIEPLYTYQYHTSSINLIVWFPESKRIASASNNTGRIWQAV